MDYGMDHLFWQSSRTGGRRSLSGGAVAQKAQVI